MPCIDGFYTNAVNLCTAPTFGKVAGLGTRQTVVRQLTNAALALMLAGAGTSLIGCSTLLASLSLRQAMRAAPLPLHPWGAAAGLFALPCGLIFLRAARRRLDEIGESTYREWQLREL